jgi:hypothetical protein
MVGRGGKGKWSQQGPFPHRKVIFIERRGEGIQEMDWLMAG